jgi:hypothetical protein
MLMSDACGETQGLADDTWTFDDDALTSLPDVGPCPTKSVAAFKPSNYVGAGPEPDQFGVGGSIFPPFQGTLATFAGTEANGPWDLYVFDDRNEVTGFEITGWVLTLTTESASALPTPPVIPPAAQTTTTTTSTAPPAVAKKTGRRAAALVRCAKKKSKEKRVKCRVKARKLPV